MQIRHYKLQVALSHHSVLFVMDKEDIVTTLKKSERNTQDKAEHHGGNVGARCAESSRAFDP
jgi:hypothetical protein